MSPISAVLSSLSDNFRYPAFIAAADGRGNIDPSEILHRIKRQTDDLIHVIVTIGA